LPEPLHRSYLYAPGSRPELMEKALSAGADVVIFDLEDAVAPTDKITAREAVSALLRRLGPDTPCPVQVRVNRGPEGISADDVDAVIGPALSAIRVPKAVSADELQDLSQRLTVLEHAAGLEAGAIGVAPIVESAAGVAAARQLAGAPRVRRLSFGATDFLADIASPGDPAGPATLLARGQLVLASRVAGIGAPVDSVHTHVDDEAGLRASATAARELGFFGKSVIHPRQIATVHDVFTPSAAELERARRIITRAATDAGASSLDGELVDPAVVGRARAILALAPSPEREVPSPG
jgi:citrate lyase subunit beta/citryl-CoA lyase